MIRVISALLGAALVVWGIVLLAGYGQSIGAWSLIGVGAAMFGASGLGARIRRT
jgi:hypothetical protein